MTKTIHPSAKHLILYDGTCGLCHFSVSWVIRHDVNFLFVFSPLDSDEGKKWVQEAFPPDSLVLIEDFQTSDPKKHIYGKGALKALKHLYPFTAPLTYLPSWIVNPSYRLVAKYRHHLFKNPSCPIPEDLDKNRFI